MVHHWSGWPGAYCLHCGSEDPDENALALGWLIINQGAAGPSITFDTPEHEAEVIAARECSIGSHPYCGQCRAELNRKSVVKNGDHMDHVIDPEVENLCAQLSLKVASRISVNRVIELLRERTTLALLAKTYIHEMETWDQFVSLKGTESMDLPVEFSNLGHAVEEVYGPPDGYVQEDNKTK